MTKVKNKQYSFRGKVWKYKGATGWHFVTMSARLSNKIRGNHGMSEEGWGRLKTIASVEGFEWKTAIWFDRKSGGYLLPIKAEIRRKANISEGSTISIHVFFNQDERGL